MHEGRGCKSAWQTKADRRGRCRQAKRELDVRASRVKLAAPGHPQYAELGFNLPRPCHFTSAQYGPGLIPPRNCVTSERWRASHQSASRCPAPTQAPAKKPLLLAPPLRCTTRRSRRRLRHWRHRPPPRSRAPRATARRPPPSCARPATCTRRRDWAGPGARASSRSRAPCSTTTSARATRCPRASSCSRAATSVPPRTRSSTASASLTPRRPRSTTWRPRCPAARRTGSTR